jgi:cytochrome c oxidase subunit 3
MTEGISISEQQSIRSKTAKPLLWVGMAGMTMIFGSLTSAYVVRQADPDWLSFDLPPIFYVSTAIIILSSISLFLADYFAGKNQLKATKIGLGATLFLSLAFVFSQFEAYSIMVSQGMYFSGSNISSSFLYVLTFVHLAHVFGGNIVLLVTFIQSLREKYSSTQKLGIELASWYWHYLTGVWIFLLLFLLYIN